MLGDVEVQDASTAVADDEKAVEHAERDRWHSEEHTRAQVNLQFLADMQQVEKRDAAHYEQRENT